MARDTNGNYTLATGNPVASGTVISVNWANPTMADVAAALTDSLSRSGDGGMLVPFENQDGDVALPGITWALEPSTGLYREGNNDMQAGVAGARVTKWFNDTAATSGNQNPFQIWDGAAWRDVIRDNHFDPITFRGLVTMTGGVAISGAGTIDNTVIGATTPAAGRFTTFTSTGIDDNATSTAITIDASGNFALGQTLGTFTSPGTTIYGGGALNGVINATVNDGYVLALNRKLSVGDIQQFFYDNAKVGRIEVTGSATSYVTSSDPRLKSEFVGPVGALDKIVEARENGYIGVFNFLVEPNVPVLGYNAHALIDNQSGFGGSEGLGPRTLAIGDEYEPAEYETRPIMAARPTFNDEGVETGVELYDTGKTEEVVVVPAKTVEPAGVDQSKRVPLLEAAIYDLLKLNEALAARLDAAGL